ncbi:putative leader peptide [Actinopolyspora sp. H202]
MDATPTELLLVARRYLDLRRVSSALCRSTNC